MKDDHYITYEGFNVRKEDISRSQQQLARISSMTDLQRQFCATLLDTEAAIGYYLPRKGVASWSCYVSVKMKYRGTIARFSDLVAQQGPSLSRGWNAITRSYDDRWTKQVMGIVAFKLIKEVRNFLSNEKTIIEADCILSHGPLVRDGHHPFERMGALRIRRGVWFWPTLGHRDESEKRVSIAIK